MVRSGTSLRSGNEGARQQGHVAAQIAAATRATEDLERQIHQLRSILQRGARHSGQAHVGQGQGQGQGHGRYRRRGRAGLTLSGARSGSLGQVR